MAAKSFSWYTKSLFGMCLHLLLYLPLCLLHSLLDCRSSNLLSHHISLFCGTPCSPEQNQEAKGGMSDTKTWEDFLKDFWCLYECCNVYISWERKHWSHFHSAVMKLLFPVLLAKNNHVRRQCMCQNRGLGTEDFILQVRNEWIWCCLFAHVDLYMLHSERMKHFCPWNLNLILYQVFLTLTQI